MSLLTPFTSVPVIDIAGLRACDPALERSIAEEIGRAARDVGFFQITGTGARDEDFQALLAATKEFFALPLEEKMRSYIGLSRCHRGYVPIGEEDLDDNPTPNLKEAFDTALDLPEDDPDYLAGNPMLGPNVWPALPGFSTVVTRYYSGMIELGRLLFRAFATALGEDPELFTAAATKAPSQLRLIHYPHDPRASDVEGIGAHTDMECFTLLRPTAPGLEVLNGAGEWIDVPFIEGALVVNIGDLLETWTNGEFVATTHRVRKVEEERYAFPLFFCVDYHTAVEPLPRFVRPGGGKRRGVVAGEHLFAITVHYFRYLRERLAKGEIALPEGALPPESFGQGAVHREEARA
ncbi:MAG: isopenicillin N synthase family dioxygenase [Segniliparus sp.]|uniref:isopenicillin N synthase family dioxygenase n=1 Tax=Segniliparus sp. TaxID=2804064 RepID=UPI003F2ABF0F